MMTCCLTWRRRSLSCPSGVMRNKSMIRLSRRRRTTVWYLWQSWSKRSAALARTRNRSSGLRRCRETIGRWWHRRLRRRFRWKHRGKPGQGIWSISEEDKWLLNQKLSISEWKNLNHPSSRWSSPSRRLQQHVALILLDRSRTSRRDRETVATARTKTNTTRLWLLLQRRAWSQTCTNLWVESKQTLKVSTKNLCRAAPSAAAGLKPSECRLIHHNYCRPSTTWASSSSCRRFSEQTETPQESPKMHRIDSRRRWINPFQLIVSPKWLIFKFKAYPKSQKKYLEA